MTIQMPNKPSNNISSVMEAASALTSLVEEDSNQSHGEEDGSQKTGADGQKRRYLPDHKKPDAALTFPEKLMAMMRFAESQDEGFCISWLADGKSFIVNDAETFTKQVVPKYFKPTKFSSFTRKLYRWGFRQINRGIAQDDPIIFGNEHFQRGQPELMAKMRSTTAAATRKSEEGVGGSMQMPTLSGMKRPSEIAQIEMQQQMLLRQLLSKKANVGNQQQQDMSVGPGMFSNGGMSQSSNSQGCFNNGGFNNGGNGNNPMSLSQMIHAGNANSVNFNMGSTNVSQPQHHQFNMNNNNMFMEQQQMMKMQQQQQQQNQNDSLLGNFNMQQDMMGMGGSQFMQQDKMGSYNQFMPQDKMGNFNQYMMQDSSQDKMGMGGNNQCYMQGQNDSSLLGQFQPASRRQQNPNFLQAPSGMVQDFPNAATTADIVNAAIQALKYS